MSDDQATSSPTTETGEESSTSESVESTPESAETQAEEQSAKAFDLKSIELAENTIKDNFSEITKMLIIEESLMMQSVLDSKIHQSYYECWSRNTNNYFRLLNRLQRRYRAYQSLSAGAAAGVSEPQSSPGSDEAEPEATEETAQQGEGAAS